MNEPVGTLASATAYSVTITVADIERATSWYEDKLGFREVGRKEYPEFGTKLRFLALHGWRVELIEDRTARAAEVRPDPPKHTGWYGVSQFCLQTTDLESVKQELKTIDIPIVWEFQNADLGVHFVFIRDPDGNLIQYLQRI
jgi:catechol 2,3-dioxygenase-like lactoylglutathione lyase family enzyme